MTSEVKDARPSAAAHSSTTPTKPSSTTTPPSTSNAMEDVAPSSTGMEEDSQRLIMEEYKIWKKNTPFLYDMVVSHALEWPSLTVQWLPDWEQPEGKDYTIQRVLLGTHTSSDNGETPPNYLMIAEVKLPSGGASSKPVVTGKKGETVVPATTEDGDEEGAYGSQTGKLDIVQKIPHKGEVNRARYAPYNPNLIATKSPSDKVYIFDKTRHDSMPKENIFRPDLTLSGHEGEGYGLAWNPHQSCAGQLISGSEDKLICMWDIESSSRDLKKAGSIPSAAPIPPLNFFRGHKDVVEDVAWSHFVTTMFASAGDDIKLLLWDTRTPQQPASIINDGPGSKNSGHHTQNINCVSFNQLSANLLASGSSDRLINLWDLRRLHAPIHALQGHTDEIFNLSFAPFSPDILCSSGADRRCYVWDLSRIGDQPIAGDGLGDEDGEDGPPELLFIHGGHTDKLADLSWNPNLGEEWMVASVSDDNILQIWQMSDTIYSDEDETAATQTNLTTASGHQIEEIE